MARVRVRMVMGSKISKVRLAKRALMSTTNSRKYLTCRQRGEIRTALPWALRKRKRSSSVPSGQTQPHHTRPRIRVATRVTSAQRSLVGIVRPAREALMAARGSRR